MYYCLCATTCMYVYLYMCIWMQADGSGLIVTVARYETPRGINIQGQGIQPDIMTPLPKVITTTNT
jgi:C-terminal processing protease CtpA/Prc